MKAESNIGHEGIVKKVENDVAIISFTRSSGCAGCSIQASCGMAEVTDKTIEVRDPNLNEGDCVVVGISDAKGFRAVFISYFIPFLFVLFTLLLSVASGVPEPVAGILSLLSLIPCYILLKVLSRFYKNDLSFEVRKQ